MRIIKIGLMAVLCSLSKMNAQNAIVNLDTVTYYGTTDTLDYLPILVNTNNNVVVAGNQKMNATQYNALLASQTSNAVLVWSNTVNPGNNKMFVTSSCNDSFGNVYTVGGVRTSAINSLDYFLMKTDVNGTVLFTVYYNGPNSTNDVASSVCLDETSGQVFVTGGSDGVFLCLTDFATLSFDMTTGSQLWCSRYNYNNSFDVATKIEYDPVKNRVIVNGASGSSLTDYDIVTISYAISNGSQLSVKRSSNTAGAGQDKAFGLRTDSLGNVYGVGTTFNGSNYDGMVFKLDTALNTMWTKTIDLRGFDDAAIGIDLDDSLNVVIVGTSNYNVNNKMLFVRKYKNNGNLVWSRERKADPNSLSDAEGLRIKAKSYKEIFIGANFKINSNQDIALLRFDNLGNQNLERVYNSNATTNSKDQFMDFEINGTTVFVSGRSATGSGLDNNIVIKYNYREVPNIPVTSVVTGNSFIKDDVIIKFSKASLKMPAINKRDFLFGQLTDFVNDSTCNKIKNLLDPDDILRIDVKKIASRKLSNIFTEADSLSETRMGDFVKIPEFYAELILTMPSQVNNEKAADTLNYLKPDIQFSQVNGVYKFDWVPNDSLYANLQSSLHTTTLYPNANINMEKAWDYTTGKAFVRVGVFDSGIEITGNPDLINFTEEHNFVYNPPINWAPDIYYHGTAVASIIAGSSDNLYGMAGIAGGGNGDPGITLVVMKIGDLGLTNDQQIAGAYHAGATGSNVIGCQALHIMNSSFGRRNVPQVQLLVDAVEYCNQNGVAFVASRGNYIPPTTVAVNASNQPATLRPKIVMNVGASGTDGNFHLMGVNGSSFTSMYSKGVDFVAPGAYANIQSAFNYVANPNSLLVGPYTFKPFGGTSASAPHVSGVASLMMSYRNLSTPTWDNLVHEDCEALLKRTATDLTVTPNYFEALGNDTMTGYGRINADSALFSIQPQYKIRHIDLTHNITSATTSTAVILTNTIMYWPGSPVIGPGFFNVDILEYTVNYTYPYSSETFIDAWPLHKASNGYPNPSQLSYENYYSEIVSATNTSAILKTYAYKFNYAATTPTVYYGTLFTPAVNSLKAAFTLYTKGDYYSGLNEKNKETNVSYFNVYPNPTSGNVTIGFHSEKDGKATVQITDIVGHVVTEKDIMVHTGINRDALELNNLPPSMYFITLNLGANKLLVKKLLITGN